MEDSLGDGFRPEGFFPSIGLSSVGCSRAVVLTMTSPLGQPESYLLFIWNTKCLYLKFVGRNKILRTATELCLQHQRASIKVTGPGAEYIKTCGSLFISGIGRKINSAPVLRKDQTKTFIGGVSGHKASFMPVYHFMYIVTTVGLYRTCRKRKQSGLWTETSATIDMLELRSRKTDIDLWGWGNQQFNSSELPRWEDEQKGICPSQREASLGKTETGTNRVTVSARKLWCSEI